MDAARSRPTISVAALAERTGEVDNAGQFFRDRPLDGRRTVPSYDSVAALAERTGEVDNAGQFFRDKLLDGRRTVPSYDKRGRLRRENGGMWMTQGDSSGTGAWMDAARSRPTRYGWTPHGPVLRERGCSFATLAAQRLALFFGIEDASQYSIHAQNAEYATRAFLQIAHGQRTSLVGESTCAGHDISDRFTVEVNHVLEVQDQVCSRLDILAHCSYQLPAHHFIQTMGLRSNDCDLLELTHRDHIPPPLWDGAERHLSAQT